MIKTIDDLDVSGKKVFVRADLNVPMRDGAVTDATRLERLAPTITELVDKGAVVIVASHFGRPKGERNPDMSLAPLAGPLSGVLGGRNVAFADDCVGPDAKKVVDAASDGDVVLLENLRYHAGEEANDAAFAQELASLAGLYVNDAFSAAHRAHASTAALAGLLPNAAGRLMQAELEALELDEGTDWFQPSNIEVTDISVDNPAHNVIPGHATARLSIRFNDLHKGEALIALIERTVRPHAPEARVSGIVSGEAFLTRPGPLSDLVGDAIEAATGARPELSTTGGTSDARFLTHVCPVVEFGLLNATMHKLDEAVALADLEQLRAIYADILMRVFEG